MKPSEYLIDAGWTRIKCGHTVWMYPTLYGTRTFSLSDALKLQRGRDKAKKEKVQP